MKRIHHVEAARRPIAGGAIELSIEFTDGTSAGMELCAEDIARLLKPLFAAADTLGDLGPPPRTLAATTPADAVLVPAEAFEARTTQAGSAWMIYRVGVVDLAFALPDTRAARTMGRRLLQVTTSA